MAKPEWGTKRTCHTCGARFYDLRRDTIVCPVCGAVHDPEKQPKPRRSGPAMKEEPAHAHRLAHADAVTEPVEEDLADSEASDAEVEDLDETDADDSDDEDELAKKGGELIEDTSELGEDDDDIGEVMEHVDDELDDKT